MINPDPDTTISGLTFHNDGDNAVTIQGLTDTLVGGGGTSDGMSGFGVAANDSTDVLLFDVNHEAQLEHVASISFMVVGSTDLEVTTTRSTGIIPSPAQ